MRSFAVVALLVSACVADVSTTTQQQHATATTIAPSKSTFSVGEPIAVTFGGFAGTATDWISIARVTDDDITRRLDETAQQLLDIAARLRR
jgi:hypothetical protein